MRIQEQAFRAYYASMKDSDLLAVAKNRGSFIPLAQTLLTEELLKRRLAVPSDAPTETSPAPTLLTKLRRLIRHDASGSEPTKNEPHAEDAAGRQDRTPSERPGPVSVGSSQPPTLVGGTGATEDQVSMVGIVPERVNKHGTKIEDIAGTGEHDSLGG